MSSSPNLHQERRGRGLAINPAAGSCAVSPYSLLNRPAPNADCLMGTLKPPPARSSDKTGSSRVFTALQTRVPPVFSL
ncbi:MAG: hypothetical protein HC808_12100 [Candidatus Competibacteraceae bacterium]|nr:hypothetical protein [Candidatus Competibacteraceae bacterium]